MSLIILNSDTRLLAHTERMITGRFTEEVDGGELVVVMTVESWWKTGRFWRFGVTFAPLMVGLDLYCF